MDAGVLADVRIFTLVEEQSGFGYAEDHLSLVRPFGFLLKSSDVFVPLVMARRLCVVPVFPLEKSYRECIAILLAMYSMCAGPGVLLVQSPLFPNYPCSVQ